MRQLLSPGKRPITLVRRLTSPRDRSRRFVAPPSAAVPDWVAEVDHERVEVVGEASGGGRSEPALVEVINERLEAVLGVGFG